jgi:hypothetical protein
MIDRLYARYSYRKEKPLDPSYKPAKVIAGRRYYESGNDKLAVIFPGWHTHNFPVNILAKRLLKHGWSVLLYDYDDNILEPDERAVIESMKYFRDKACADIERLTSEKPYRQVHFICISLGGVPMAMVCDKFKYFTGVTAVVGGDDLAVDMWYGARTAHFRKAFESMHIGIRKLAEEWDYIGPDHHLKHFNGKSVKFILSKHDTFVPTKYQKKLAKELIEAGAKVKIYYRRTGHILTITRFCLLDNPI